MGVQNAQWGGRGQAANHERAEGGEASWEDGPYASPAESSDYLSAFMWRRMGMNIEQNEGGDVPIGRE
jgi:hypothetical protein